MLKRLDEVVEKEEHGDMCGEEDVPEDRTDIEYMSK